MLNCSVEFSTTGDCCPGVVLQISGLMNRIDLTFRRKLALIFPITSIKTYSNSFRINQQHLSPYTKISQYLKVPNECLRHPGLGRRPESYRKRLLVFFDLFNSISNKNCSSVFAQRATAPGTESASDPRCTVASCLRHRWQVGIPTFGLSPLLVIVQ
jgi:hypothetical protein